MKDRLIKVGSFLAFLAGVSFIFRVVDSALREGIFARYRTVWLYEIDYFSVFMIFGAAIIGVPALLLWHGYKERKIQNELKRRLEENRKNL